MGEKFPKKLVEVRILEGGKEGVVLSASAGDEIVWTTEPDGPDYDIKFPLGSPFKDANGVVKTHFKVRKGQPAHSGKAEYRGVNGKNDYDYGVYQPVLLTTAATPTVDQTAASDTLLKDPIVIVDP